MMCCVSSPVGTATKPLSNNAPPICLCASERSMPFHSTLPTIKPVIVEATPALARYPPANGTGCPLDISILRAMLPPMKEALSTCSHTQCTVSCNLQTIGSSSSISIDCTKSSKDSRRNKSANRRYTPHHDRCQTNR